MILADKIIEQRKKCGWSQEELAEKLKVSRQAVSKWEGAQSTPDLARILELGRLFGVSTDYLLKDELETEEGFQAEEPGAAVRTVTLEEADAFLQNREQAAPRLALATFMCILSPICLLLLGALSEKPGSGISENLAGGLGLAILFFIVCGAVVLFMVCGSKSEPFAYLEKESFETAYGVAGMVRERQKQYHDTYVRSNVLGACLCILSVVPLLLSAFCTEDDFILVLMVAVLLLLVGFGVTFFIRAGVRWESLQKLLQEGDYTRENKRHSSISDTVSTVYWLIVTAIFLGYSFYTNAWYESWIIWPVAGVLFAAVMAVCRLAEKKN